MRRLMTLVRTLRLWPRPTVTPPKVKAEVTERLRLQSRAVDALSGVIRADYARQDQRMAGQ